ncbi:Hsp20/alpha crystallin family protein [Methylovirgula sp. HY1]|uniref:Hsp20/alpha crystallin family protein n=1 Tax=Methylovirgula sp. HY1 TaxID=2822761 RepID=UPI001C5B1A44|nr:Hsp20/alpha crystallin family protein [Methylovirgula sp. HY1]QXX74198.1 Spore protein SP21 [Methylovirgula sp. HY1]
MTDATSKIPIKTEKKPTAAPATIGMSFGSWEPLETLRREIDHMFGRVLEPGWRLPFSQPSLFDFSAPRDLGRGIAPAVDVVEKDKDFEIIAELPGLDEKNIEVKLSNGTLVIKGEKTEEKEEHDKDYHICERRFGSFSRSFQIPPSVDTSRIDAHFSKGVLTVKMPKSAEAMKGEKTIEVKAA